MALNHLVRFYWKHKNQRRLRTMSDKIVQLNEKVIKTELKELVRQSVEDIEWLAGCIIRLSNKRKKA